MLIASYNRIEKTKLCLKSLLNCYLPENYILDIFLLDDGSDGTYDFVKNNYSNTYLFKGNGNMYWAGGMRYLWEKAKLFYPYDAYLLLNDDVVLFEDTLVRLIDTLESSYSKFKKRGIAIGATSSFNNDIVNYSGYIITRNDFVMRYKIVCPKEEPIKCQFSNANILLISKEVVDKIGIFDSKYIHSLADFDYTYTARLNNFPLFLAPGICGNCINDHGKTWVNHNSSLRKRIDYLMSPKGLSYYEYLYFYKKHFPKTVPYFFSMLWLKTFFPILWDKFKHK